MTTQKPEEKSKPTSSESLVKSSDDASIVLSEDELDAVAGGLNPQPLPPLVQDKFK